MPTVNKPTLTQQQLLRQRLLPQQLRLVALLEAPTEEVEQAIARELDENPALERTGRAEGGEWRAESGAGMKTGRPDFTDVSANSGNPEPTLSEYIHTQLNDSDAPAHIRAIAGFIIGALDSNGYLTRTIPQLTSDLEMIEGRAQSIDDVRRAAALVRSLEPAGVGAYDLRDSLLLQLQRLDSSRRDVADALEIVRHYFDIYSRRNNRKLSEASGLSAQRIADAHSVITSLNPKPGAPFASDNIQAMGNAAVTPDFVVETDGERINVSMPNSLPELQIEESFRADDNLAGEAAAFIRDRRRQARSFIDLLKRRQDTLMSIARAIVKIQAPFFLSGDDESKIRPMVLRNVAEATRLDLSMVSRAVAGKWIATEWGVYPLKSFFNHRTGADDADTSAREIGAVLREIISAEPADSPLSDEALAAALTSRGYNVARRTVAKYRTRLNIPPARLRRN